MITIHKYELPLRGITILKVPKGSVPLSVQTQGQAVFLWMQVDTENEEVTRAFRMFGTGHKVDADASEYIGTVQMDGFVWHFYARPEVANA